MFSFLFGKSQPRNVHLEGRDAPFVVKGKETILEAALTAGVPFPSDCRVGACGSCKCRLLEGTVEERSEKAYVLSKDDIAAGYILGCQSSPKTDIRIALGAVAAPAALRGRIAARTALTHDIVQLVVELDGKLTYRAGQYAQLTVPSLSPESRSYSFARAPLAAAGESKVVFYVREVPGGALSPALVRGEVVGLDVTVEGPRGEFYLREGDSPVLLIAGGSGLAPIRALAEDCVRRSRQRKVIVLFGARTERDLYDLEAFASLARAAKMPFKTIPVLSHEPEGSAWQGARGFVTQAIEPNLGGASEAYLCGPPPMIDAALPVLAGLGIGPGAVFFDKFTDKSHTA